MTSTTTAVNDVSFWPKNVRFGAGSVSSLGALLDEYGCHRAMVVCGQSVATGPMLEIVRRALGARMVGVFSEVRAHTPLAQVQKAADMCRVLGADVLVSVGGGSAIDAAKGIVVCLASNGQPQTLVMEDHGKRAPNARPIVSQVRHIAIPTTAGSGSDVMPSAGIRDPDLGKKLLFWDRALIPDATILDPTMAVYAPAFLTAASGMTAFARAMESLYSLRRNPVSTGLAVHALRLLNRSLPVTVRDPHDLEARQECQFACIMASNAVVNSMASLVHAIGHVVGGKLALQHGVSHAILLAPAARIFVPSMGADTEALLQALGVAQPDGAASGDLVAAAVTGLVRQLPLPQRLRDLGLERADFAEITTTALQQRMLDNVPVPVGRDEVMAMLDEVW